MPTLGNLPQLASTTTGATHPMDHKQLIQLADIRKFSPADLKLPDLPADGKDFLHQLKQHFPDANAAYIRKPMVRETLEITSHQRASASWFSDRHIRCIVWPGDLTIDGDLKDDDFSSFPVLIVTGSLSLRHWLHGGMHSFIGGSVKAAGYIIGYYNDSCLFVGGDVTASGYIPRAKPQRDFPKVKPHQIKGKIAARQFDNSASTNESVTQAFVKEALTEDGDDLYIDEHAIFERFNKGLPVWK